MVLAKTDKVQKYQKDLETNDGEWAGKVQIRTSRTFLAAWAAYMAIFWPTQGFKGRTFHSSGFSTEGTLICAYSAYPLRAPLKKVKMTMQVCYEFADPKQGHMWEKTGRTV